MRTLILLLIVAGILMAACSSNTQTGNNTTTPGAVQGGGTPDNTGGAGTPAGVPNVGGPEIGGAPDNGAQGGNASLQQCKETIPYQTLMDALPRKAAGYTAHNPEGTTLTWTEPANSQNMVKYSTASEVLTSGNSSVIISVLDTCYVQYLSAGWRSRAAVNSTQGYLQQTTINGYPAWEQFDRDSNTYALNILIKDRVLATVQGTEGATADDVRKVAESLDYGKITNAAKT